MLTCIWVFSHSPKQLIQILHRNQLTRTMFEKWMKLSYKSFSGIYFSSTIHSFRHERWNGSEFMININYVVCSNKYSLNNCLIENSGIRFIHVDRTNIDIFLQSKSYLHQAALRGKRRKTSLIVNIGRWYEVSIKW